MAGEDRDERDRLRFTLRRLRQEDEEEEEQPELPQRNDTGEREADGNIEGAPRTLLLFRLSQSMDQMDNMFELTPTTDTPSSSFNNNPPLSSASTSNNALLPSLPSSSNSASRGHGPIFDIASFMEESRQRQEARDREETEAAEENTLRLRTVRQTMVVPGESTSSPSSDQLSEEEWSSSTRRRRRRRSATGSDDQAVSDVSHPLSVTHSHTLREAALDCPSTTDSEPDQLLPGTKYESTKYQRVPTVKKHVLEKQRRDLEQTQEYVEKISSKTKLKATPPSSQDSKTSGSSDYIASAQSGLSCSLESTSSTTVQETDEGGQDADCTLDRSHGLFKFKGRIVTKFDHNTDNREPMTDAEIIDSVATIAEEGTQDLFSVNDANNDSQYERTNTVPRWMLQQQKEQESEQTDLEELTEETQRGEKRSRLDSSPSSGTDPTLSPTMKPPTKRPAGRIQSDSSCNSNESTGGSKGLKIAVTTTSIKSPTSSIELSSSYSQSITSTLQSVSSGYMPSGSSLTSSSDIQSSPSLSSPPVDLPCVGPVTDSEGDITDFNFIIMPKGLLDFDTTATSSNSNNNNNDKKTSTTTTTTTTNTNSSSSDSSSGGKEDKAKDKRGEREGERDDNGGRRGGDSNERGDRSGQDKEQTSDQTDGENQETKIVEESELQGNDDRGSSGEELRELPSSNMEDTATTANDATNEQLKLLKGRADNSIITIDDTNNDKDESELTESLTNDSCIVIQKESLIDSLQPSLTIDSPNLPFSPEREEKTHSIETGSVLSPALLANDSRIDSAHTLEGNCTDTSAGTQNSFRLHVSPSQSAMEPDDDTAVFVIGSSTESTKGDVLSHSPLKLSSDSIPSTTPPVPSHSIPSTTPPVPVYESLQLSNTEVSSTNSMILSTSPISNVIITPQADVSQTNSSGTFDFRLPDSDMLLPTDGTSEAHVEDMETDTGDNDQSTKEQTGSNGVAETKGRSPGKCLSLRRRRSMSSGENTPKKLKQDQSTAKATDPLQSDTTIDSTTNGVRNGQGNKEIDGSGKGETRRSDRTGSTLASKSSATIRPTASLRTTATGFILGLTEEEGDNCDTFDDSSHFELPPITALNSESEVSPSDISFTKTDGVSATTNTGPSLPLAVPSSLFAGLQHTRRKDTRRTDPYEFQEEDSNTDTPLFMPLRRRQEPQTSLNNAMESENPLPLSTIEDDTEATAESEKEGEAATVTSTPVRRENIVVSGSTSQAQTQELVNASTPLTTPSNVSTIASSAMSSLHFVSPITCLTPQGVKDIFSSNPFSPLIRLRHSTTVITSHVFIRDEIIDRNTEKVIQTLDHVVGPSEERKVSIEATPLSSAHVLNPIPAQQLSSSSYVSTPGIPCPASIQSTSSISHDPMNPPSMNSSVYNQPLRHSISPLSATASSHVVNSSCTENHLTPSTSVISSEARSQSTTPTGRSRAYSPLRSQSLDLDSLPSTLQCTTSSVVKNKSHQSGFKLVENQKVIARWKDGKWYAATIVEVSPIKAYLHFYDGDYSSVSVQHILPLACIPQGVKVSSADTDISGSLLDFSIPDSTFRMKLSNDTIMKCSLEDLVMTADTAEMTLQLLNTQSKQVKKRKKSVSKRPQKESLSHKESVLFSGMIFLVTDQRSSQPTGREEIEQILRDRGGYIMDEYKPNLVIDNRTFCLSNTYCRTLKYLTAIAVSLPCVSYNWIMECVKQGKIVSWEKDFSLLAGVSPSTKQQIKWKSHATGFLKVNVFLSGSRTFKEIWQKVISCGGGHVISKLPRKSSKESQFTIVSESSSIPVSLKDFLVVSPEWLVECLLAGKVVSPEPFKRS